MDYPICLNPNCKSYGRSHPNCRCQDPTAERGSGGTEGGSGGSKGTGTGSVGTGIGIGIGIGIGGSGGSGGSTDSEGSGVAGVDFTPDNTPPPANNGGIDFTPDDQHAATLAAHGTPLEQAKAGLEGLAKGIAGPLATATETKVLGVDPKDIQAREEANPLTHYGSEAVGLGLGAATGSEFTQAGLLGKLGAEASTGLSGAAKVATSLGVENAFYTLGDEVSKAIVNSPDSVQAAAMHVGLSGLLGAAGGATIGKLSNLWLEKIGPQAEAFVKDFTDTFKEKSVGWAPSEAEPILSKGAKAATGLIDSVTDMASEAIADSGGAFLGKLTGIPGASLLGAYLGHKALSPMIKTILPTLIKPMLESESSAIGLKTAMDTISAIAQGDATASKAAKAVFGVESTRVLNELMPSKDRLDKLQARVDELGQNPLGTMEVGGMLGHYMPAHQTALATTSQNAINYLNANKPRANQPGVLDRTIAPSNAAMASYNRTLNIAEQPLILLNHIQKGTLQPKDIQDLNSMYPALVPHIVEKLRQNMIDHISKGHSVPFRVRGGLGMLMGQPMDSTFSQPSIMSAQLTYATTQPPGGQGAPQPKKSTAKLGKSAQLAASPLARRQEALLKA